MPELPEVETVRRQLEPLMTGRRLAQVAIDDSRLTRPLAPESVAELLAGHRIVSLERRGKYLVFELESGLSWLVHLRMTGSFAALAPGSRVEAGHRRATLVLDDGLTVIYRDVRRFGTWAVMPSEERTAFFSERLGPEPLSGDFSVAWLSERLASSRAPIKANLLDQRTVAGVGNIYADESLWRARLHPARPSQSLCPPEIDRLVGAVRDALARGIERQGATLRDYRAPNGESGAMQDEFAVYGRDGEPCERCSGLILKTRLAGRGTWFCGDCQPLSEPARPRAGRR